MEIRNLRVRNLKFETKMGNDHVLEVFKGHERAKRKNPKAVEFFGVSPQTLVELK